MPDLLSATLIGRFYPERNREYPIRVPVMSIGSAPDDTVRIPDPRVSPCQVRIVGGQDDYRLEVVGTSLTTINGVSLRAGDQRALAHGDVIVLSGLAFEFTLDGAVRVLSRVSVLAGVHRGKCFRIERPEVLIGRAPANDVQFPDLSVSRRHCRIRREDSVWWIEDLLSTNGTLVNGAPIRAPEPLHDGDEVSAGYSRFRFEDAGGAGATALRE